MNEMVVKFSCDTLVCRRDRERHEAQMKLAKKEGDSIKECLRQSQIKFLEMTRKITSLEKSLANEKNSSATLQAKVPHISRQGERRARGYSEFGTLYPFFRDHREMCA